MFAPVRSSRTRDTARRAASGRRRWSRCRPSRRVTGRRWRATSVARNRSQVRTRRIGHRHHRQFVSSRVEGNGRSAAADWRAPRPAHVAPGPQRRSGPRRSTARPDSAEYGGRGAGRGERRRLPTGRTRSGSAPHAFEHRAGLLEPACRALVGGVQQRRARRSVGDLQQRVGEVADVGRATRSGRRPRRPDSSPARQPRMVRDEVVPRRRCTPRRCAPRARPAAPRARPAPRRACCAVHARRPGLRRRCS